MKLINKLDEWFFEHIIGGIITICAIPIISLILGMITDNGIFASIFFFSLLLLALIAASLFFSGIGKFDK